MSILTSIPAIVQAVVMYGPTVKALWDEATSNDSFLTKLEKEVPVLGPLIATVGATYFPKASPALQKIGAVVAAFDPNVTKWLQGELNAILSPSPPLVVDGLYGPKTIAAVEQLQTKLGLAADGIAGSITQAAIQAFLVKKPTV